MAYGISLEHRKIEPTYIKLDPRWLDVFVYKPETKLIHREIKVKGVKTKVAARVPTKPRPADSYRGARRNKRYEDLAWRRECTIH